MYAVCLQQRPQAEGVGLLQEGDSPGTVKDAKICFWMVVSFLCLYIPAARTKKDSGGLLCTVDFKHTISNF